MPILNTKDITLADVKKAETSDLLETYNHIMRKEVKKFASRAAAESQTWKAIGSLAPGEDVSKEKKNPTPKKEKRTSESKRDESENRIIQVLVKENPKRPDSRAFKKFGILMEHEGLTIREFKNKEGKFPTLDMEAGWPATELRWAVNLGLVKLVKATAEKAA